MKSICVYCGSQKGDSPSYQKAAQTFGKALAENHFRLIYGAGDLGLMGIVSKACHKAGGQTLGVIPQHIITSAKLDVSQDNVIITQTMHERKKIMFMNADAVVALPGGIGTIDELIEVITWRQLGLHNKQIIIMNIEGYWDTLLALIDQCIVRDFATPHTSNLYSVVSTPQEAIALLTH